MAQRGRGLEIQVCPQAIRAAAAAGYPGIISARLWPAWPAFITTRLRWAVERRFMTWPDSDKAIKYTGPGLPGLRFGFLTRETNDSRKLHFRTTRGRCAVKRRFMIHCHCLTVRKFVKFNAFVTLYVFATRRSDPLTGLATQSTQQSP